MGTLLFKERSEFLTTLTEICKELSQVPILSTHEERDTAFGLNTISFTKAAVTRMIEASWLSNLLLQNSSAMLRQARAKVDNKARPLRDIVRYGLCF